MLFFKVNSYRLFAIKYWKHKYFHYRLIRKAKPSDAKVLTEISFSAKRYWNYPEEYIEKWKDELTITENCIKYNIVFTECINSRIAEFYSIVNNPHDQTFWKVFMKEGYWMDHIFIRPENIKQGIGSKLISHLKNFCKNSDIQILTLFVDPNAKGFYEKSRCNFQIYVRFKYCKSTDSCI